MSAPHVLVRVWTYLYTFGLPSEVRDRRCAEIESDLWESEHDPDIPRHAPVLRLLRGLPADLLWRLEVTPGRHYARAAAGVVVGTGVLAMTLWAFVPRLVPPSAPPRRLVRVTVGLMPPPPPPRQASQ
jgi:hypothetical protein